MTYRVINLHTARNTRTNYTVLPTSARLHPWETVVKRNLTRRGALEFIAGLPIPNGSVFDGILDR